MLHILMNCLKAMASMFISTQRLRLSEETVADKVAR